MRYFLLLVVVLGFTCCTEEPEKVSCCAPWYLNDSLYFPTDTSMVWKYLDSATNSIIPVRASEREISVSKVVNPGFFERRIRTMFGETLADTTDTCGIAMPFACTSDPLPNPERLNDMFDADSSRYAQYGGKYYLYSYNSDWSIHHSNQTWRLYEEGVGLIHEIRDYRSTSGLQLDRRTESYLVEFNGSARDTSLVGVVLKL